MNLTYLIAKYNMDYRREYKKYINYDIEILENYQNDYLINISNALVDYDKSLYCKVKYNEIEKKITIHFGESQKLFITVDKQYLLFEYDNKQYIVKDCHVFLELIRIFKKYIN